MIPALRAAFNRNFLPETYDRFLDSLAGAAGTEIGFRVSETPCFLPKSLLDQMADYGREMVLQLVESNAYREASDVTVPQRYNVANESPRPMFLQVDFGLVRNGQGELEPKLVELQAFPPSMATRKCWHANISRPTGCQRLWESILVATITRAIGNCCGSKLSAPTTLRTSFCSK